MSAIIWAPRRIESVAARIVERPAHQISAEETVARMVRKMIGLALDKPADLLRTGANHGR